MQFRAHVGAAIGGVVGFLVLNSLAAVAMLVVIARIDAPATTVDVVATISGSTAWRPFGLIALGLASGTGAYIASRIARERPLVVGLLSLWLFAVLGIFSSVTRPSSDPIAMRIGSLVLMLGGAAIGGYIAGQRMKQSAASSIVSE